MSYDAIIVIDMQTALINEHPYNEESLISNIWNLLTECRNQNIPVIYIRHNGKSGDEFEAGTAGWQIYEKIAPLQDEKIIDKHFNSAFRQTGLKDYLDQIGAKNLILCGMQTEYCFDISCKVAFEFEYKITIAKGTTSTFDTTIASGKELTEYFEEKIWKNRYARVIPCEQLLDEIKNNCVSE